MNEVQSNESWHWKPEMSVGVDAIDKDHQRLFQLFYEAHLIAHNKNELGLLNNLARELIFYTESHFKREEAIMQASSYPFCDSHFALHRTMAQKLHQELEDTIEANETIAAFIVFLKDWFIEHIKKTDQHIKQYTKGYEQEIELALNTAGPLTVPKNITIYVVDDEPQQVEMVKELLDVAGLSAKGFTSAVEFISEPISSYDIVLLDLNMPEMDGIEVMRHLHAKGSLPSYVLISGFDEKVLHSTRQFADAKKMVVAKTLTKPLEPYDFIEKIKQIYADKKIMLDKSDLSPFTSTSTTSSCTLADLQQAIESHYFVLFYQPQIELISGKVIGFEALVRLQHPDHGLIFPDQFIGLAEQKNLISSITNEVIDLAIIDYGLFCDAGIKPKISINMSAQDLLDLSLPEQLDIKLANTGIPVEAITFELTESAVLTSTSDSLDIMNRLRMKGFALSIDDFGTGHSSLVQLYQAPFTELKIDQSFVKKMLENDEAMSIVKVCIYLAKELKMETVAEGVETEEIWNKLKELGCDIAQGYYRARPMPLKECCDWLTEYRVKH